MQPPVLLLDIDGVLAPFGGGEGYKWHPEIRHFYSPRNAEYLRKLAEHYRLVWATGWEHHANRVWLEVHDLEPLEVIQFGDTKFSKNRTWKLDSIIKWADKAAGPLAWIDDDLHPDALNWADQREIPTLFLQIPPAIGLTAEHVEILLDWADTLDKE